MQLANHGNPQRAFEFSLTPAGGSLRTKGATEYSIFCYRSLLPHLPNCRENLCDTIPNLKKSGNLKEAESRNGEDCVPDESNVRKDPSNLITYTTTSMTFCVKIGRNATVTQHKSKISQSEDNQITFISQRRCWKTK